MKILDAKDWLSHNERVYGNATPTSKLMEDYAHYYHFCKVNNSPTSKDYDHVDLILQDADKYGLREEVEVTAQNYLNNSTKVDIVTAYNHAYNDWIK